jgi:hypothetical protein
MNKSFYDKYIELRVHGYPAYQSFVNVFGAEHWGGPQQGYNRIAAIESTQYYQTNYEKVLDSTEVSKLWCAKKAISGLLSIYRDPLNKCSTRLAAEKELNILTGVVVVDENGKTKAGRSLDDFYAGLSAEGTPKDV